MPMLSCGAAQTPATRAVLAHLVSVAWLVSAFGVKEGVRNAYVHVPFCRQRCFYCDFPIRVVSADEAALERQSERYLGLLEREMRASRGIGAPHVLETLYIGGGTPSLMPAAHLRRLLTSLEAEGIVCNEHSEFTMEMDPGTFDSEKLEQYLACGVNRVSLGLQSFQDDVLESLGRFHRRADVYEALDLLRQAGISNVSVDLISGLPGRDIRRWEEDLREVSGLVRSGQVNHVSVYDLQVEDRTVFGRRGLQPGDGLLPTEDVAAKMYCRAHEILEEAALEHYEVSNYALPGCRSRHNSAYWKRKPFYGMGMGAASFLGGKRFSRPRSLSDYKLWVALLEEQGMDVAGRLAEDGEDVPDHSEETDAFLEEVMLGLRTKDGIDMEELAQKYGEDCAEQLRGILQPVEHVRIEGKRIGLVAPEGFLLSNDIISTVFAEVDDMGAARSTQRPPCVPVADGPCSGQEAHLEKGAG